MMGSAVLMGDARNAHRFWWRHFLKSLGRQRMILEDNIMKDFSDISYEGGK